MRCARRHLFIELLFTTQRCRQLKVGSLFGLSEETAVGKGVERVAQEGRADGRALTRRHANECQVVTSCWCLEVMVVREEEDEVRVAKLMRRSKRECKDDVYIGPSRDTNLW